MSVETVEKTDASNYIKLAHSIALKYKYKTKVPFEDIEGASIAGLVKAIKEHDSSKGAFSTIAYYTIKREISNLIRAENTLKRKTNMESISLHQKAQHDEDHDEIICFVEDKSAYSDFSIIYVNDFLGTLSKLERNIVLKLMKNKLSNRELGEIFGYSDEWIRKIRLKIKNKYLEYANNT